MPAQHFQSNSGSSVPISWIQPGQPWNDSSGRPILATGGGITEHNGIHYWFGECRRRFDEFPGVAVYASRDLMNWENRGIALPSIAEVGDEAREAKFIERPKVIHNDRTGQFVMWMHVEWGKYQAAYCGVAVAARPEGPYRFLRSLRPNHRESRDCTLFKDADGTAYFVSSTDANATLAFHRLTDDYLDTTGEVTLVCPGEYREAPTLFRRDGKYHLLTSGCTGFPPNPLRHHIADAITGPWRCVGDPCVGRGRSSGFESQPTYVIQAPGNPEAYVYCGDRWRPDALAQSTSVWLPMEFDGDRAVLRWVPAWNFHHREHGDYQPTAAGPALAIAPRGVESPPHVWGDASVGGSAILSYDADALHIEVHAHGQPERPEPTDPWRRTRLEVWADYHQFCLSIDADGRPSLVVGAGFDHDGARDAELSTRLIRHARSSIAQTPTGGRIYRLTLSATLLDLPSLSTGTTLGLAMILAQGTESPGAMSRVTSPSTYSWGRMPTFHRATLT